MNRLGLFDSDYIMHTALDYFERLSIEDARYTHMGVSTELNLIKHECTHLSDIQKKIAIAKYEKVLVVLHRRFTEGEDGS